MQKIIKYKYSIYNSIVKSDDNSFILYNAFTHANIRISDSNLPALEEVTNDTIISFMHKHGFIVDSSIDEAENAINSLITNLARNDNFYLMINPTLQCNCRCWYCIEKHVAGSINDMTISRIKSLVVKILSSDIKSLTISFFGGEPFLQFDNFLKPFMQWSSEICQKYNKPLHFVFTTNGLLINDKIIEFVKQYPNSNYQITLDSGRQCHNNTRILKDGDSYGKVIHTMIELAKNGIDVIIRLNLTHQNIKFADGICNDFKDLDKETKQHLRLTCQQVWQDTKNGMLNDQFFKIKEKFIECDILPDSRDLDWIRSSCYGDRKNAILVNYNGDLYKCSAVDYYKDPTIGNIESSDPIKIINSDFDKYLSKKTQIKECKTCRIFPLCASGCYKRIMINPQWECLFKGDKEKDYQVLQNIEEIAYISSLGNPQNNEI